MGAPRMLVLAALLFALGTERVGSPLKIFD
jgi:hypothetical protein